MAWVWRQLLNATPEGQPRYLIRDRDAVYGQDFAKRLARLGIRSVRTPIQAPRANAIAERLVETFRRECLDHVILLNENHLRTIPGEFVAYYNGDRPRRSLRLQTAELKQRAMGKTLGCRSTLGGLHHSYEWAA